MIKNHQRVIREYTHTCKHMRVYTYTQRERQRDRDTDRKEDMCTFSEGFREGRKQRMLTYRLGE